VIARLTLSFKTHNLVRECKRKIIPIITKRVLPEEMDDLEDVKCSQE